MAKRFLLFLLCSIFALCGMVFVGCGNSVGKDQTYAAAQDLVSELTKGSAPFKSATTAGIETDFYINNFMKKNESDVLIEDDEVYIILTAMSLNYFYKYYGELEELRDVYNFSTLYQNILSLNSKYSEMKERSDELNALGNNAQSFVFNGYFLKYKASVKEFVGQSYKAAVSLGDLLINNAKITSKLGTQQQNLSLLSKYFDYQSLLIFKDFSDFFVGSCNGQIIDTTVYTTTKSNLKSFCQNVVAKSNKTLSPEDAVEFITMSDALAGERRMFEIAIKGFSFYDYKIKYEESIDAYEKVEKSADAYLKEIERYFLDSNSSYKIYLDYVKNKVKNV